MEIKSTKSLLWGVDISALKVGDTLMVTATENVKTLQEFTASEIQLQPALTK